MYLKGLYYQFKRFRVQGNIYMLCFQNSTLKQLKGLNIRNIKATLRAGTKVWLLFEKKCTNIRLAIGVLQICMMLCYISCCILLHCELLSISCNLNTFSRVKMPNKIALHRSLFQFVWSFHYFGTFHEWNTLLGTWAFGWFMWQF